MNLLLSAFLFVVAMVVVVSGTALLLRPDIMYEWIDRTYGDLVRTMPAIMGRRWHERTYRLQATALRFTLPLAIIAAGAMTAVEAFAVML